MAKRRGKGEGSITRLPDGRWQARLSYWEAGRRRTKAFYGRTRREAQDKLAAALADMQKGIMPAPERQTLGQFLDRWLDVAKPTVRPRTFMRYKELLLLHVVPVLGRRPLARLSAEDLQALYSRKLEAGLSARTVTHIHRVLHRVLQDALRWGLVARNVCDAVRPPKAPVREVRALGPDEARRLLDAAAGDPLEALYVLALTAGLRQGELLGLKWEDIDLESGRLQVRRTLQRIRHNGWAEAEPKSRTSRRNIVLTPLAIEALRRHRTRQLEQRLKAGQAWEDHDLVFCNSLGRAIESQNLLRRSFWPLLQRAGLPHMRFHDLRHTAATLLLAEGVHPKVVQEMLGHSSISLTLDTYSHVLPHLQAEAAERMQQLLGR